MYCTRKVSREMLLKENSKLSHNFPRRLTYCICQVTRLSLIAIGLGRLTSAVQYSTSAHPQSPRRHLLLPSSRLTIPRINNSYPPSQELYYSRAESLCYCDRVNCTFAILCINHQHFLPPQWPTRRLRRAMKVSLMPYSFRADMSSDNLRLFLTLACLRASNALYYFLYTRSTRVITVD